jgi:hypothetical protein
MAGRAAVAASVTREGSDTVAEGRGGRGRATAGSACPAFARSVVEDPSSLDTQHVDEAVQVVQPAAHAACADLPDGLGTPAVVHEARLDLEHLGRCALTQRKSRGGERFESGMTCSLRSRLARSGVVTVARRPPRTFTSGQTRRRL